MATTEPRFCTSRQLGEMLDPASGTLPLFSRQTILDELHGRALARARHHDALSTESATAYHWI